MESDVGRDGTSGLALQMSYDLPEDGPGTLLLMGPETERAIRWTKSARIRLPGSERWVAFSGVPVRAIGGGERILGLGTQTEEDQEAFLELKEEMRRTGARRLVVELTNLGGGRSTFEVMSDADRDRMLSKREAGKRRSGGGGAGAKVLKFAR